MSQTPSTKVKKQRTSQAKAIEEMLALMKEINQRLISIETLAVENKQEITILKPIINTLEKNLDKVVGTSVVLQSSAGRIEAKVDALSDKASIAEAKTDVLNNKLIGLNSKLDVIEKELNLAKQKTINQKQLNDLDSKLNTIIVELSKLQNNDKHIEAKVDSVENKLIIIDSKQDIGTHKVVAINSKFDLVEKDLKESKQQDRKRQYLIDNLEFKVSQIRLEINELQQRPNWV
jgi:chromosome segregation ATPase